MNIDYENGHIIVTARNSNGDSIYIKIKSTSSLIFTPIGGSRVFDASDAYVDHAIFRSKDGWEVKFK